DPRLLAAPAQLALGDPQEVVVEALGRRFPLGAGERAQPLDRLGIERREPTGHGARGARGGSHSHLIVWTGQTAPAAGSRSRANAERSRTRRRRRRARPPAPGEDGSPRAPRSSPAAWASTTRSASRAG